MGIFHKLSTGIKRSLNGKSIDYVSGQKSYGNNAEDAFSKALKSALSDATIKSNIMIDIPKGRCEIDTLLKYKDKLFIIEVKHWKGVIVEQDGYFLAKKIDKYTKEIHQKHVKSPFGQVKRQAYLLKEMSESNVWINTVVFFFGADVVRIKNQDTWFTDFNELVDFITSDGRVSNPEQINRCLKKCKSADYIYASAIFGTKSLHCIITPASLIFNCYGKPITKDEIKLIRIVHRFSYDELYIELRNGESVRTIVENGNISVINDGIHRVYSFSKIDCIIIGE